MKTWIGSVAFALLVALPLLGQVDSFTLRAKYGDPLNREMFKIRPGIEMTVDYGPAKQVCRMNFELQIDEPDSAPMRLTKEQAEELIAKMSPGEGSEDERSKVSSALRRAVAAQSASVMTKEEKDRLLDELVPPSVRGNRVNSMNMAIGGLSRRAIEYDRLIIAEKTTGRTEITIRFKDSGCPTPNLYGDPR